MNHMLSIDKNVALPYNANAKYNKIAKATKKNRAPKTTQQTGAGRRRMLPFDIMNVGDSFYNPSGFGGSQLCDAEFRTGFGLTTRKEGYGQRVWRAV